MKVNLAEFIISAVSPTQYPTTGLPEIALAGRSNVGKSSLINTLIQRRGLAKTSSKPGKTQTLNYYLIEEKFYFVDLPGYGYAKVSKSRRDEWAKMIDYYLSTRPTLRRVMHLVDIRHEPTSDDKMMYDWLAHYNEEVLVVATKMDKIKPSQVDKHLKVIRKKLDFRSCDKLIAFSTETKKGTAQVWEEIEKYL